MTALRVAIVGFGKIARDQHVPAIAATDGVTLAAVATRNARLPDVPRAILPKPTMATRNAVKVRLPLRLARSPAPHADACRCE